MRLNFRALVVSVLGAVFVACGPLIMIPGGELSGTVTPIPSDWSFSDAIDTVQLETRPSDPYSVNVWGVGIGKNFYVAAGDLESRWAVNLAEDPRVKLRLGKDLYELKAIRTQDPTDRDAFLEAIKRKYDFEPKPDQRESSILFRLEAR